MIEPGDTGDDRLPCTMCIAHAPIKLVSRFFVDGFSFAFHSDFLSFPQYHIENGIEHGDI